MTLAIILIIAAVLSLAGILTVAVSRSLQVSKKTSLPGQIQAIDVVAFRNLVDPAEDAYLRHRLPGAEFRSVRRERLRAMASYVQTARKNAVVLGLMGQQAMETGDPRTAEAAKELIQNASLLQMNTTIALFKIYVALAWPGSNFAAAPVIAGYERLNGSAMLLGRLQNPIAPTRIAASL